VDASERLSATEASDARRTVDASNDRLSATDDVAAQDDVRQDDETWSSRLRADDVHHGGHLPPPSVVVDDQCVVCRRSPPPDAACDLNSNLTSSDVTASGGDVTGDSESRDEEECRRLAEQMSAAWRDADGRGDDVLDQQRDVIVDDELEPPTTLAAPYIHVRSPAALQLTDICKCSNLKKNVKIVINIYYY